MVNYTTLLSVCQISRKPWDTRVAASGTQDREEKRSHKTEINYTSGKYRVIPAHLKTDVRPQEEP